MKITITDNDKEWNSLKRNIEVAKYISLSVGAMNKRLRHKSAKRGSGITVSQIGLINEFGSPEKGIPERSFMRSTIDKNKNKYSRRLDTIANWLITKGVFKALAKVNELGRVISDDIKKTIETFSSPGNASSTVKRKGFDNPLIETSQLKESISYKLNLNKKLGGLE